MTMLFAVLPNIGVGVPVGGNSKASRPTIGAAPSGSAPSFNGSVSREHP